SEELVNVLNLNADIWKPSVDVYARYNISTGQILNNFSICYRLFPTIYAKSRTHLSFFTDKDDFLLYHTEKYLRMIFLGKSQKGIEAAASDTFPIYKWSHYCHIFNNGSYSLYYNGHIL
ncbi:unnamed protein product, partial [Meganyctiphanes norvegica]